MLSEVVERIEAVSDAGDKRRATNPKCQETDSAAERKLELKICERCGGLWLRPTGSRWIYCGPCKAQVDQLPAVRLKPGGKAKLPTHGRRSEGIKRPSGRRGSERVQ